MIEQTKLYKLYDCNVESEEKQILEKLNEL